MQRAVADRPLPRFALDPQLHAGRSSSISLSVYTIWATASIRLSPERVQDPVRQVDRDQCRGRRSERRAAPCPAGIAVRRSIGALGRRTGRASSAASRSSGSSAHVAGDGAQHGRPGCRRRPGRCGSRRRGVAVATTDLAELRLAVAGDVARAVVGADAAPGDGDHARRCSATHGEREPAAHTLDLLGGQLDARTAPLARRRRGPRPRPGRRAGGRARRRARARARRRRCRRVGRPPTPRAKRSKTVARSSSGHAGPVVLDGDPHVAERLAVVLGLGDRRPSRSPPPCSRALSIRLATTRARRRRSPLTIDHLRRAR